MPEPDVNQATFSISGICNMNTGSRLLNCAPATSSTTHKHTAYKDLTSRLVLSIDLGTTSIKIALVDSITKKPLKTAAQVTKADIESQIGLDGCEQNPVQILHVLHQCISTFDKEHLSRVVCLAITGQMHGVMLWRSEETSKKELSSFGSSSHKWNKQEPSQLITWRDQRCKTKFLACLPPADSHLRLATGHGCATLFWMARHQPDFLKRFDCAGTIMDYLVSLLCGLTHPVMSPQIAASWGYFNTEHVSWNTGILKKADFPVKLLPHVKESGSSAGNLKCDWFSIPKGIPVLVALGDLQCAIRSTIKDKADAVLNISTSTQLGFPISLKGFKPPPTNPENAIEYFPYFGNTYIATVASLTGGSVMANFVKTLQEWFSEFGVQVEEEQVWKKLIKLAEKVPNTDLQIIPTLQGERHKPDQRGSVAGLNMNNMSLGKVFRALCSGLVQNLHEMMPNTYLEDHGIKRIIASGSGVTKNPIVQQEVKKFYKTPMVNGDRCDSALGAALCAINSCNSSH
ncbi:sedoheptulokinase [Octopus bimaculoides]|uniref:Sedoheptulokinase n=1 Tax=Octopus bimaculoides TaxID=37653 RepID=A0A0L8G5T8_OCTBM|nr:sedoheptulokinase [Octopus bimaculoides]|eukprot:XP_014783795.1 PREDICTED: sedoheptulokinase-like [Octopus bimaculoides]